MPFSAYTRPSFSLNGSLEVQWSREDRPRLGERPGLDRHSYATHSLRRTKAALIYRKTKNLRAVQLLLGHTKLEGIVRYPGIEVDDALEMAEQMEIQVERPVSG